MARHRRHRSSSRFRSRGGGIATGAIGGIASALGGQLLGPQIGPVAGLAAAGKFRHSDTLMTLAGMSLGAMLGSQLNLGSIGGTPPAGGGL